MRNRWNKFRGPLSGAALAAIAAAMQAVIWPYIPPHPWILFYPCVTVAAFVFGYAAGVAALGLSAILGWYLFIPPTGTFAKFDPLSLNSLGIFVALAFVTAILAGRVKPAIRNARESMEALCSFFENSRDAMIVIDAGGKCLACNTAATAMFGVGGAEVTGMAASKFIDPGLLAEMNPSRHGQGDIARREWVVTDHRGRKIAVEASSIAHKDGMWTLNFNNVSDRRAAETSFKAMIEGVFDAIIVVDTGGIIRYANQRSSGMFGYEVVELVNAGVEILVPEESREKHKSIRAGFMKDPQPRQIGIDRKLYARRRDGSVFVAEIGLTPVRFDDDTMILAVVRDVSSRAQEVDDLHRAVQSRVMFEALCENSSDFIAFSDEKGVPVYINPAGRAMIGIPSDYPVESTSIPDYYPEDLKDFERDVIHKSMIETGRWQGETKLIHWQTKRLITVSQSRFNIMHPQDGRFLGIGTIVRDIGELKSALERAESANRAKSDFLAMMSHEIRTPLGVILGYADMLFRNASRKEQREVFADAIRRNGQHLLVLINDILDLAKVESGRMELASQPVNLPGVLRELHSFYLAQALAKGLELEFRIDGNIPGEIFSDDLRLRQILINVIGNALKFTVSGKVTVVASSATRPEVANARDISISVSDTGCGISPADQEKLFESFVQAGPYIQRRYGGTGLGLALARKLARKLGGDLRLVRSVRGVGSVFEITLRAELTSRSGDCDDADYKRLVVEGRGESELRKNQGNDRLDGAKILLVEDFEDNQVMLTLMLQSVGASVDVAGNGADAIKIALAGSYDVVLMDIQMPVMNGYEATHELRECGFERPIIALTASAMKGEMERCLAAGCTTFIAKPVQRNDLIETVRRYLPGRLPGVGPGAQPPVPDVKGKVIRPQVSKDDPTYPGVCTIIARMPAHVAQMKELASRDEWQSLQLLAHQIRGLGGTIGLPPVSELAARMEDELKSGTHDKPTMTGLIRELDEVVQRIEV